MGNEELVEQQNEATEEELESRRDMSDQESMSENIELDEESKELDQFLETVPDAKPNPEDMLAAFYEMHRKAFIRDINALGANALRRIMIKTLEGEFTKTEYAPARGKTGDIEKSAIMHFNEGVEKRMLLRFEMEFGKAQEAYEKEQADLKKIEELNKLSPEAQKVLDNMQGKSLEEVIKETNG